MEDKKVNCRPKTCDNIDKQMAYDKVRAAIEKTQVDIVEQIDERLTKMIGEVMREVEQSEVKSQKELIKEHKNRTKSDKPGNLPEKLFVARNSILTDLFDVDHGRSIYNIFIVIFVVLFVNAAIEDIIAGKLNLGLHFIRWCFGEFQTGTLIWFSMALCTFAVYSAFYTWANYRADLSPKSWQLKAWDNLWLIALIVYQACFFYFPAQSVMLGKLPPATATAVLMEQVRMVMKSHAFVRSNVPRALAYKPHGNPDSAPCPGFSHFLYFFFCPSLVYRDDYLRTKSIRWKFVAKNYLEVIGIIFFSCFLFERYLVPSHRDYGKKHASHEERIALVFGVMMPSMLALAGAWYCLLHSWMNASAEILRFADRMFYQDWWNAKSYSSYHRKWNVVIHDWLYTYIYKEMCDMFTSGKRLVPMLSVFTVSAIIHEYVIALTLGFFYPVMLFTFGLLGLFFVLITSDKDKGGNLFFLMTKTTGPGFMTSLYLMEWYSRINCVQTRDDFADFFIPRSWTCVPIQGESMFV